MMSMTTLKSASQASTYYSKDNYYTTETTAESIEKASWYGKGASALELDEKEFDTERFKELLNGEIDENKTIGRVSYDENGVAATQHRPGVDLTFSAPKSVSIMSEVFKNEDVRDAHEEAVKATLDQVEKMYAQTRISVDGSMQKVDTENLVIALFSHNNSRELDPQTHTHAVIMNATLNQKGEWSALSNEQIYQNQKLIGAIYNSELANNLNELGFDLEFKPNGNFEIAGIGQDAIDEFSQRRKAMIESAEARGIDLSTASAALREQVALKTRTSKKDVTQEKLDNDWSERAQSLGLSKDVVEEINRKAELKRSEKSLNKDENSSNKIIPKVDLVTENDASKEINKNRQEDNRKVDPKSKDKTDREVFSTPGSKSSQKSNDEDSEHSEQSSAWQEWLNRIWNRGKGSNQKERVLTNKKDDKNTHIENEEITPREKHIRESVFYAVGHHTEREMMVKKSDVATTALKYGGVGVRIPDVMKEFDRLVDKGILVEGNEGKITTARMAKSEVWSIDHVKAESFSVERILSTKDVERAIAEREEVQKYPYTEGQRNSLKGIFTNNSRYYAVDGLAGVGKTTMLLGLNKIATDNGFIVKGMAEGGVAAKNLEEETGIPSSTVAKFKLDEQKLQNEISAVGGMDRKNEIWVVDESSFSGQESFAEILKLSKNANARVVFLGDKLQMQSIAAGKPFEVLQDKMAKSEMQNINRQKTDDLKEVVALITAKNEKGDITLSENQKAFDLLDKQGNVIKHKQEELHSKLVESYMSKSLEERNNSLIITPFNADRELINDMVRERKKEAGELSGEEHHISVLVNKNLTKAQQTNYREYEKGDVVRFNKEYKIDENTKVEKDHYYKVMGSYTKKDGQKEEGLILQDKNGNLLNWKTKNKNLVEVYKEKEKELQKGDLIKINRSNGDFKNGEKYSFHEIRGNEVILRNEKGHEKVMPKEEFKHWDHGYANTIYSSQGLTKSSVFMLINSETLSNAQNSQKAIKNLGKIFGNRAFYVGVTRASQELKIFTHDKDVARGAVAYEQDKTSFVQDGNTLGQQDQQVSQKGFDMEI
ncbi:MobF family relaxase [Acinetobacter baumannii]